MVHEIFSFGSRGEFRDNVIPVRSLDFADLILAKVPAGTEVAAAESLRIDPIALGHNPAMLCKFVNEWLSKQKTGSR